MKHSLVSMGLASGILLIGGAVAKATPLPTYYQGRALGMGGSSLASADDATAAALNPASLEAIEEWSATITFSPFMPSNTAPFSPGDQTESERGFVPLMFAGAGVRIFDHGLTGLAIYAESGSGATYNALPQLGGMNMGFSVGVMEVAIPFAYELSDQFSVGAGLRLGFTMMSADMPVDPGTGPMRVEEDINGFGFPGASLGIKYKPLEQLSFAAVYRSKLTMDLSGDGTATAPMMGEQRLAIESEWSTPHTFAVGAAFAPLPRQLLITTDVRYSLLDEAVNDLTMAIELTAIPNAQMESTIPLQWKDSLSWMTGVEYRVEHWLPLRAGYGLTTSATPEDHAAALVPSPGLIHSFHLGAGLQLDELELDLGGAYGMGSADVTRTVNGPEGTYSTNYFLIALSATYRPAVEPDDAGRSYSKAE